MTENFKEFETFGDEKNIKMSANEFDRRVNQLVIAAECASGTDNIALKAIKREDIASKLNKIYESLENLYYQVKSIEESVNNDVDTDGDGYKYGFAINVAHKDYFSRDIELTLGHLYDKIQEYENYYKTREE